MLADEGAVVVVGVVVFSAVPFVAVEAPAASTDVFRSITIVPKIHTFQVISK